MLDKAGAIRADAQESVVAALLKREQLGTTGIGNGSTFRLLFPRSQSQQTASLAQLAPQTL